jgi:hypothetical protein
VYVIYMYVDGFGMYVSTCVSASRMSLHRRQLHQDPCLRVGGCFVCVCVCVCLFVGVSAYV